MKSTISLILKNLAHPFSIIGLIIALAIPFLIYLAPNVNHKETIRLLDLNLPYPLFIVQTLLGLGIFISLNKDFRNWIKEILPSKNFTIIALLSAILVTIFAGTQIEARHRVQSDESVFMSVAQNMYYNHNSATCHQGDFSEGTLNCTNKGNSFKTKGLAFLYTIGMPFLGNNLHWIFKGELLLLPLSFLLLFLAILAWTKQELLAYFAALLLALQPTVLFQFRSMSVEPLYIFLSALSLLFFKWAYDKNTTKHWALLALSLAFFAQTRQETIFCLFPFILFSLPKLFDKKSLKAPTFFVLLSLFTVPVLLTISFYQGFGFQGGEFSAHGHFFEDLVNNWKVMTKPLNNNGELANPFLTYFNWLFLIGLIYLIFRAVYDFKKENFFYLKILVFLTLYHIQTYVIFENVSGDFGIEINQRYSLVMLPSMAFLAALPLAHLVEYLGFDTKTKKKTSATFVLALLFALLLTGWTFHYKKDFNNNIMYNRNHLTTEEVEIWNWIKTQEPKKKLFIYGRPWHFIGYGVSSFHYDKIRQMKDSKINELLEKFDNEVYYIRGLDCWDSKTYHKKAVEHRIATTCDVFEREMNLENLHNVLITNNYPVQISKFKGRKKYNLSDVIKAKNPIIVSDSSKDSLQAEILSLKFELREKASKNWNLKILLENKIILDTLYTPGKYDISIEKEKLQPGYNNIQYLIIEDNKLISQINQSFFFPVNGIQKLTDFPYKSHKQEWGTLHVNQSLEGHSLTIKGIKFENGLATHAASETIYTLEKKFNSFRTTVGLDDESLCSEGVTVQIIGDDVILAETPIFKSNEIFTLTAHIEGVQELTLKTIPKGSIDCSHVDFVHSILIP